MNKEFGYIVDNKVIANAFLDVKEREIGEVKETEKETFDYFVARFEMYKSAVDKLLSKIKETSNKGSYLVKVQDLLKNMSQECALGDFESIYNELKTVEAGIVAAVEANRVRNKSVKDELILNLENLLTRTIVPSDIDQVEQIKSTWTRVGKASVEDELILLEKFNDVLGKVTQKLEVISGLTEELIETRVEQFSHLISEAKKLFVVGKYKANSKVFKEIQTSIKEIGFISPEKRHKLWEEFNKIGDDFFVQVKKEFEKAKSPKKGNFESLLKDKKSLIEKVNAILESEIKEAVKTKNILKAEYKKIAFNPSVKGKELDSQFYDACSYIEERSFVESLYGRKIRGAIEGEALKSQKVRLLNDLIKKDLDNLNSYEENATMITTGGNNPFASVVEKRKRELNRGLSNKKKILSLLKNETTK